MVREDGEELYLESSEVDWRKASDWVNQNVKPHLTGALHTRAEIAAKVRAFAGIAPEFWAYFAAYDWVVPPGARVVSHQFPIGTWAPDRTVHVEDKDLFLWTIPPR